mmetsp:Transcript_4729/g.13193  ORF Transcript_4729/g.13193 Transcript_4729/m.13193 type:complete len:191 (-) Transcript_4729:618-1190(-)|eukprot:CAMPEP_0194489838 /NCGR_PEP_ID=MMETSP0253-20130528/9248_1 /TAXON_ID=2966 /ORGANISM="Noctiluca scintillans" /LENGTH=190 /DNA_ID=CAMNT_0039330375 /DNA_START=83 /DNA_END=655 /DNA_ORIENTATION=-
MARRQLYSLDEEQLEALRLPMPSFTDAMMASSWPAATLPSRHRPEPPRAPLRKPSDVNWDVPLLSLPEAPKRKSFGSPWTAGESDAGVLSFDPSTEDDFADDDEGVFALDDGTDSPDEDLPPPGFDYDLIGLEDFNAPCGSVDNVTREISSSFSKSPGSRGRLSSSVASVPTGASPTLMSILEQVAAEAA